MNLLILGGDTRNLTLANYLKTAGYKLELLGLDQKADDDFTDTTLIESIKKADYIIGPIPFSTDGHTLHMPLSKITIKLKDLTNILSGNKVLIGGKIPIDIADILTEKGITVIDYLDRNEMSILNSIPTAEGAIQIALEELPITLHGANALVFGYGKCGKTLSQKLYALGCKTYVCARKSSDYALCEANYLYSYNYKNIDFVIGHMDVIFNTVPAKILNSTRLAKLKPDCLVIDLSSMPGGCDFEFAAQKNIKIIHALSLPGKVAPKTAGNILFKVIEHIIEERS